MNVAGNIIRRATKASLVYSSLIHITRKEVKSFSMLSKLGEFDFSRVRYNGVTV